RPLLTREDLLKYSSGGLRSGGLIVIGSHVQKTTRQLELLLEKSNVVPIEFNTHLVIDEGKFASEINRVQKLCSESIEAGKTTVVYTCRKRFDLNTGNREDELRVSVKIAAAVTGFVSALPGRPAFIIAKGGITSSEIGTVALGVKKALVLGQILPGIPVWLTGSESRFPNTPYIIFPGNVGDEGDLRKIADMLE
ncbi:MAG: hydroxyacid dehydrogenase, partial [Treponema sp.]|nr:hydroxyacid dehydrogenase [Treponema sp.]